MAFSRLPPLDQPFVEQRLHLFIENKRTGPPDLLGVVLFADLDGEELGVVADMVGIGAGNLEPVVRQGGEVSAIRCGDPDRFPNLKSGPRSFQFFPTRMLEQIQKGGGTTVPDRRLIGVQFNQGVVDVQAAQSGKQMLHRADLDAPLGQGGGAFHLLHLFQKGRDDRLIGQIHPAELVAGSGRGWLHGQTDLRPAMQGGPRQAGFFFNRRFPWGRHPAFYTFPPAESSLLSSRFAPSARMGP